jgi:hypothetical protein
LRCMDECAKQQTSGKKLFLGLEINVGGFSYHD